MTPSLLPARGPWYSTHPASARARDHRFFGHTGGMLVGANDGAVDEHFLEIRVLRQLREESMPNTSARPACEALIGTIPRTKLGRQVSPRATRTSNPQHRLNEPSIVRRCASRISGLARQQCCYPLILIITQPKSYHPDPAQKSGYDHKSHSVNGLLVTH